MRFSVLWSILISGHLYLQTNCNLSYPASRSYLCSKDYRNPEGPPKICEKNSELFRYNTQYYSNKERNDWSQIWNELKDFDENGEPVSSRQWISPLDLDRKSILYDIFTKSTAFDSDLLCSANFADESKEPWSSNLWLEFPEDDNPYKRLTPFKPGSEVTLVYKFRGDRKPETGQHGFIDIYMTKDQGFRPQYLSSRRMQIEDLSDLPFCSVNRKIQTYEWIRIQNYYKRDQRPIWQFKFKCKFPESTSTGPHVFFSVMKTDNKFKCDTNYNLEHRSKGGKCRRVYFGCSDVLVVNDNFEIPRPDTDFVEYPSPSNHPSLDRTNYYEDSTPPYDDEDRKTGSDVYEYERHDDISSSIIFWLIIGFAIIFMIIFIVVVIFINKKSCCYSLKIKSAEPTSDKKQTVTSANNIHLHQHKIKPPIPKSKPGPLIMSSPRLVKPTRPPPPINYVPSGNNRDETLFKTDAASNTIHGRVAPGIRDRILNLQDT